MSSSLSPAYAIFSAIKAAESREIVSIPLILMNFLLSGFISFNSLSKGNTFLHSSTVTSLSRFKSLTGFASKELFPTRIQ